MINPKVHLYQLQPQLYLQNAVYVIIFYCMKPLESLIQQLENQISNASISNLSVSNSSVGWQIEHSLLTIKLITEQLKKSDPINTSGHSTLAES